MTTRLQRPRNDRMLAGVVSGLANYFGIDVTIMRLVFVLAVLSGLSPLVYVILWIVMPEEPATEPHRYDPATGQPLGQRDRIGCGRVGDEAHGGTEQALQLPGTRGQRILGIRSTLGPSQMGEQHHPGALLPQIGNGRERRADPGVVGDHPVLDRTVEVDPHQGPSSVQSGGREGGERTFHSYEIKGLGTEE